MIRLPAAAALALALLAGPALAETRDRPGTEPHAETPGRQIDRALEDLTRRLEALKDAFPYGLPSMNEQGDIVIPRRERPPKDDGPPPDTYRI